MHWWEITGATLVFGRRRRPDKQEDQLRKRHVAGDGVLAFKPVIVNSGKVKRLVRVCWWHIAHMWWMPDWRELGPGNKSIS